VKVRLSTRKPFVKTRLRLPEHSPLPITFHCPRSAQHQINYLAMSYQYPQQSYGQGGPPQLAYPWTSEWDYQSNRYIFLNRETGQRTFEYPAQSYGSNQNYASGRSYNQYEERQSSPQEPQAKSHTGRNVALGAIAGLAGGALLMHEGEKVGKGFSR
jgi:hypothetical protein